jgi:ADP-ribose pyrophosphatase YjhB (NUDIX family)
MFWQPLYQLLNMIRHAYWFVFHPDTFGVKVVIEQDGKYLFIRHGYGSKRWTFPGGGIKKNETPSDAVRRETREEVRIELQDLRPLGTFNNHYEYKNDTVHAYYATTTADKIVPRRGEIIAYGWFPKDDLPKEISVTATETLKLID